MIVIQHEVVAFDFSNFLFRCALLSLQSMDKIFASNKQTMAQSRKLAITILQFEGLSNCGKGFDHLQRNEREMHVPELRKTEYGELTRS